jgi:UPF0176 protein
MSSETEISIYYTYTTIADPVGFVKWHKSFLSERGVTGRILIAEEGINGTMEGTKKAFAEYEAALHAMDGSSGTFGDFRDVWFKHSPGTGNAFPKLRVRARSEVVTLGLPKEKDINPNEITGTHLTPAELKAMIDSGENIEIIDMRNNYEFEVGHFKGSINPKMENFRDLPKVLPELAHLKDKKVVTVCTYGVRCEKASGYLKSQGFSDVYQLNGGIGSFMKEYPGQDFLGSLYVFDERVLERFTDDYERVGKCYHCAETCENYHDCSLPECHRQMIVCTDCKDSEGRAYCKDRNCKRLHQSFAFKTMHDYLEHVKGLLGIKKVKVVAKK